jgi:hypothetical protein
MTENVFPLTLALSLQGRGGKIDSRLRGNDKKGSGNDIKELRDCRVATLLAMTF